MGYLVFTDLDGTLLDHHDYSWEGARAALDEIDRRQIPIIFTTSKTRAELLPLRKRLDNHWPFITENGGAVFFPADTWPYEVPDAMPADGYRVLVIGRRYKAIRSLFVQLQKDFPIRGFGDMTVVEIASLTGLDHDGAELAGQREFSEPFLLDDQELLEPLNRAAAVHDCRIVQGGRFYHFMDKKQDKGNGVAAILSSYRNRFGQCTSIGLGDSANDLSMLDRVDIPVLIARPDGSYENYGNERMIRSRYPGSRGWGECILKIINQVPALS